MTTATHHTKNTLKETVFTRPQQLLIATSPFLFLVFSPAPPSAAAMSWENSKDNSWCPGKLEISEQEITTDQSQSGKAERDGEEQK